MLKDGILKPGMRFTENENGALHTVSKIESHDGEVRVFSEDPDAYYTLPHILPCLYGDRYKHKKTGDIYVTGDTLVNCTNKQDQQIMVIYISEDRFETDGLTFCREVSEFLEKFELIERGLISCNDSPVSQIKTLEKIYPEDVRCWDRSRIYASGSVVSYNNKYYCLGDPCALDDSVGECPVKQNNRWEEVLLKRSDKNGED